MVKQPSLPGKLYFPGIG